ncbi:unnamed protein product [Gongylonema pulchrum]|uniref:Secreted protein n=1 Tax=Gongylonema pulchrum TaxID=637853 RepID=A0A183EC84_9BILA|nr:unnamed protein product [Gongylonema pulchrum]
MSGSAEDGTGRSTGRMEKLRAIWLQLILGGQCSAQYSYVEGALSVLRCTAPGTCCSSSGCLCWQQQQQQQQHQQQQQQQQPDNMCTLVIAVRGITPLIWLTETARVPVQFEPELCATSGHGPAAACWPCAVMRWPCALPNCVVARRCLGCRGRVCRVVHHCASCGCFWCLSLDLKNVI